MLISFLLPSHTLGEVRAARRVLPAPTEELIGEIKELRVSSSDVPLHFECMRNVGPVWKYIGGKHNMGELDDVV